MDKLVYGHRGYPVKYPENTIASFLAALIHGADGVELDVWLSGDGEPVVIHDPDTRRVSGAELRVKDVEYKVLRSVYLGMGQTIPRLIDVYEAVPDTVPLIIELKDRDATGKVYELTYRSGRLGNVLFTSFNHDILRDLRRISDKARLGVNIGRPEDFEKALKLAGDIGVEALAIPITAPLIIGWESFGKAVEMVKKLGLKLYVWTPIGSKTEDILHLHEKLYGVYDAAIVNDAVREGGLIKKLMVSMK